MAAEQARVTVDVMTSSSAHGFLEILWFERRNGMRVCNYFHSTLAGDGKEKDLTERESGGGRKMDRAIEAKER